MGRPGIGRLTSGIGILHLFATLPLIALVAGDILAAGIFGGASDSFPPATSDYPVILAVFSTLTGILLLVAGGLLTHMARQDPSLRARLFPARVGFGRSTSPSSSPTSASPLSSSR